MNIMLRKTGGVVFALLVSQAAQARFFWPFNGTQHEKRDTEAFGAARISEGSAHTLHHILNVDGLDINQREVKGATAAKGDTLLLAAVKAGNREAARYLIEQGANPNKLDYAGNSALRVAVASGDKEMVKIIACAGNKHMSLVDQLKHEARKHFGMAKDARDDASLLTYALANGKQDIAHILLEHAHVNPDFKDKATAKSARDLIGKGHDVLLDGEDFVMVLKPETKPVTPQAITK